MGFDVVSLGTAVVDYFVKADDAFLKGNGIRKGSTNFILRSELDKFEGHLKKRIFLKSAGDNGRNTCEGVARLGGRAAYASNIGKDEEGRIFARSLADAKVAPLLTPGKGRTGKIIALLTPDNERTFLADLGCTLEYEIGAKLKKSIASSKIFYATSITTNGRNQTAASCIEAMKLAKKKNVIVAYSLESPLLVEKGREKQRELVAEFADMLFANENELMALTGERDWLSSLSAAEKICEVVALKQGKNGSIVSFAGERKKIASVPPKKVVDTTGAGDFYAAGFLFGVCRGKTPEECGKIGAALATKTIELFGARIPKKVRIVV